MPIKEVNKTSTYPGHAANAIRFPCSSMIGIPGGIPGTPGIPGGPPFAPLAPFGTPGSGLSCAESESSSPPLPRRRRDPLLSPFRFFLRSRWTPARGSISSLTVQYAPFPRSVSGRETFSKQGLSERLCRTEFWKNGDGPDQRTT